MQWRLEGGLAREAALGSVLLWAIFGRAVGSNAASAFACGILVERAHFPTAAGASSWQQRGAWPGGAGLAGPHKHPGASSSAEAFSASPGNVSAPKSYGKLCSLF